MLTVQEILALVPPQVYEAHGVGPQPGGPRRTFDNAAFEKAIAAVDELDETSRQLLLETFASTKALLDAASPAITFLGERWKYGSCGHPPER